MKGLKEYIIERSAVHFEKFEYVTILVGPIDKTLNNEGYVIELKSDSDKYVVLLKSKHKGISYEMHIENESGSPMTQEEKDILFKATYDLLDANDVVTYFGECTPRDLVAIENLVKKYGFKKIDTYSGEKLYWASPRLIDNKEFNEFINDPNYRDMFEIVDSSKPLSIANTTPVISIVKK